MRRKVVRRYTVGDNSELADHEVRREVDVAVISRVEDKGMAVDAVAIQPHLVMAYIVMADIVMADIVMASYGPISYGPI